MSKTLSNVVIRNENQYLKLLSLSDYYYYPVWDLSRYLETLERAII